MAWVRFFRLLLACGILHIAHSGSGQNTSQIHYQFLKLVGDTVLTSSGNLTSQGHVVLLTSGSRGVLDLQGGSTVTFPQERCLIQNLYTCGKGFTLSVTFRTLPSSIDPKPHRVYLLDSGSDRNNSNSNLTGMTLSSEGSDRLVCVWADTSRVWRLELQHGLAPAVWHQLHVSWHPVLGLSLWAGLHVLGSSVRGERRVAGPGPLRIGSLDNPASAHLQVSGLSVMEVFVVDVLEGGLAGLSTASSVKPKPTRPLLATTREEELVTSTKPPSQNFPMIAVRFLLLSGQQMLTTLGTMTTYGKVVLEPVSSGLVLVLDAPGEFVDMGYPLPCLRDVTSCRDGFSLRITFELIMISLGHNILLSSGGDLLDSSGMTLSYFNRQLIFVVKTNTSTWMGLFNVTTEPGFWYTVAASWDGHNNGTLFVDNVEVPCRVFSIPHPPPSKIGYPLLLAAEPGRQGTTLMKVFEVDFWAAHRDSLSLEDLNLPSLPNNPPATFTVTLLQSTGSTSSSDHSHLQTQSASNERFEDKADERGDDNKTVVVVLGTSCALLFLAVVVGCFAYCRSRRHRVKRHLPAWRDQSSPPPSLSLGYAFRSRPHAYHNHIYSTAGAEMMY